MWYHELEDRLLPLAFDAACEASPNVRHVELRLENGSVKVVVSERPTVDEQQKVAESVKTKLQDHVADATALRVQVTRGFRYMFTMHLKTKTQTPKKHPSLQHLTMFKVAVSEVMGLRTVYDDLVRHSNSHDFVATTALGGVPGLLHIIEAIDERDRPDDVDEQPAFFERMRQRFHLFPGLLWSETSSEADLLFGWLQSLPAGCSVLMFDTGTDGSGVRRISNCIQERMTPNVPFSPALLSIIGVVDGVNERQKIERVVFDHTNGRTTMAVEYQHVPNVLTEDCQQLLGYDSIRRQMMFQSLHSNAVIELVDDEGQHIQTIAAMSGASALRRLIRLHSIGRSSGSNDAVHTNRFLAGMILRASQKSEWLMLANAVEYGLIDFATAKTEAINAEKRAKAIFESNSFSEWDFDEKKVKKR